MKTKYAHLNELQQAELDILKEFIAICTRHQLIYYIYGGTLLGAYRHKGFIPWDDDVDIAMPRKDFERFKSFLNEFPNYLYLDTVQMKGHSWTSAQIMDTRLKIKAGNAVNAIEKCVWVDILIIDGVPNPKSLAFKLFGFAYLSARLLFKFSRFSDEVDLKMKRPWYERFFVKFAMVTHVEKVISQQFAGRLLDWVSRRYDLDKCEYVATLSGPTKLGEVQPKSWFGIGREMQFEDIVVNGMSKPEKFFEKYYGPNYMTPPPMDERNKHNVEIIESLIESK